MSLSWAQIVRLVEDRARGACEYCRMLEILQLAPYHVEHIVPKSKNGSDDPENLAWSCGACNLAKSNRTRLVDPATGEEVPFFNPRSDRWDEHFEWGGYKLIGRTSVGRALIVGLDLNHMDRLYIRQVEHLLGLKSN